MAIEHNAFHSTFASQTQNRKKRVSCRLRLLGFGAAVSQRPLRICELHHPTFGLEGMASRVALDARKRVELVQSSSEKFSTKESVA